MCKTFQVTQKRFKLVDASGMAARVRVEMAMIAQNEERKGQVRMESVGRKTEG